MEILGIIEIVLFVTFVVLLIANISLKVFLKRTRKENTKELHLFIKIGETLMEEDHHFSESETKTIMTLLDELKRYRKEFVLAQKRWLNTSTIKYIRNDRKAKKIMDRLSVLFKK